MIQHIWSVLCTRSILDSTSNSISLIDSLEEIAVGGIDLADLRMKIAEGRKVMVPMTSELVTLWSRGPDDEPDRGKGRLIITQPGGATVTGPEYDIDLSKYKRLRQRSQNPGLPFVGPGRYVFRVQVQNAIGEWLDMASVPLWVHLEEEKKTVEAATPEAPGSPAVPATH